MGELGIHIQKGEIVFDAALLNHDEILQNDSTFEYYDLRGMEHLIKLGKGQVGFTFCQVPVIYTDSDENKINVYFNNGTSEFIDGKLLNNKISEMIFKRTDEVERLEVSILNL